MTRAERGEDCSVFGGEGAIDQIVEFISRGFAFTASRQSCVYHAMLFDAGHF